MEICRGPAGAGKTRRLEQIERQALRDGKKVAWVDGGGSTEAGLVQLLERARPDVVLVDELHAGSQLQFEVVCKVAAHHPRVRFVCGYLEPGT